jgi:hypothetical protein
MLHASSNRYVQPFPVCHFAAYQNFEEIADDLWPMHFTSFCQYAFPIANLPYQLWHLLKSVDALFNAHSALPDLTVIYR